ncbi:hypothetical protein RMN57_09460 [Kitasatospora sp. CM 4170]|uniref:Cellulose synthase n=1 Tax=Kitasatospora aburaviensis TaxID=67265 RepID=A0ABW1ET09_9ACTN|nr:hypothetical protein [Kitasatospora sp. CM 4170]WNM44931.1 hypothetical protein RMN57_09460 [Kitasatospora sp. CM 4170]
MLTAAVAFALTAAGVAVAGLRAHRRRFRSATRWFAVALLPAGLYLSGLFPVARTIGGELADWATDLVFSPRIWTGLALLAVSAALLVTTRLVARRRAVGGAESGPAAAGAAPARSAVAGSRAAPAGLTNAGATAPAAAAPKAAAPKSGRAGKRDDGLGDEFDDIEEILRRRGI